MDLLSGERADDLVDGGGGIDTVIGGAGDDTLRGGESDDRFVFDPGSGSDEILDLTEGDLIDLSAYGVTLDDLDIVPNRSPVVSLPTPVATISVGGAEIALISGSEIQLQQDDFVF